jgi:hypothetical protein
MAGQTPTKRLRIEEFRRLAAMRNWRTQEEIANGLGVDQSQVSRVLAEVVRPGDRFKEGCVRAWGSVVLDFLFEDDAPVAVDGTEAA